MDDKIVLPKESAPAAVTSKTFFNEMLANATITDRQASAHVETVTTTPTEVPVPVTKSSEELSLTAPPEYHEPIRLPIEFDLLKGFNIDHSLKEQEKKAESIDMTKLSEQEKTYILKMQEDAERGKMIEYEQKKEEVKKLQDAMNSWIPVALASNPDVAKSINLADLEKFLSVVPAYTNNPASALNQFLKTASKHSNDLQKQNKATVEESQKIFKERVTLAMKLKENEELLKKQESDILALKAQLEEFKAQNANNFNRQMLPSQYNPPSNSMIPTAVVVQQASKSAYEPLSKREHMLFNCSYLSNEADAVGLDTAYNLAKSREKLFSKYLPKDPIGALFNDAENIQNKRQRV